MNHCSIILTMHALTQWNLDGKVQGQFDTPLNAIGHQMAALLAKRLSNERLTSIYSSDLRRSLETAAPIGTLKGIQVVVDMRLREKRAKSAVDTGEYPVLPHPQATEEWTDVEKRMFAVMEDIASENVGGNVLVVSHGGATRVFVERLLKDSNDSREYERKKTGLNRLEWKDGSWTIVSLNDDTHLSNLDCEGIHANRG